MKKTRIFASLTLGLLVLGAGAAVAFTPAHETIANAEAPAIGASVVNWYFVGSANGWNKSALPFEVQTDGSYKLTRIFEPNEEFKGLKNENGGEYWLGATDTIKGCSDFTGDNGNNIKYVGEAAKYTLTIKNNTWQVPEKVEVTTYAVTVMDGDKAVREENVIANSKLAEKYIAKEGFFYRSLFTDKELTKPYNFDTPVTAPLTLYAKYEEIGDTPDKVIMVNNTAITKLHAWRTNEGPSTDWKNPIMFTAKEGFAYATVPAEMDINSVILRTNENKSGDLSLDVDKACWHTDEIFFFTVETNAKGEVTSAAIHNDNTIALNTFIKEFRNVRKTNGYVETESKEQTGICNIAKDSELVKKFEALGLLKNTLEGVKDFGEHNVLETMNYIMSRVNTATGSRAVMNDTNMITTIVVLSVLAVTAIALVSFVAIRRKRLVK